MKKHIEIETSFIRKEKYRNSGKSKFISFLFTLIVIAASLLAAYNLKNKFESSVTSYDFFDLFAKAIKSFVYHSPIDDSEIISFMYINTLMLLGLTLFVMLFINIFTYFARKSKFYFNHYKLFRLFRIIRIINLLIMIFLQFYTKLVDLEVLPLGSIDGRGYPASSDFFPILGNNIARLFNEDSKMFIIMNLAFILLIIPMIISFILSIVRTVIKYHYAYATFAPYLAFNLFVYVHLIARKSYVYKVENYNEDYYKIKKIENKSVYNLIAKIVVYGLIIPAVLVGAVWLNHQRSVQALDKILFRVNGIDIYRSHLLGVLYGYLISGLITVFIYYKYYYGNLYIRTLENETENKDEVLANEADKKAETVKETKTLESNDTKEEVKTGNYYKDVIAKRAKANSNK